MSDTKNESLAKEAEEFLNPEANIEDLWKTALKIVTKLYGQEPTSPEGYNMIRINVFKNLSGDLDVRKLPPTDHAVLEHTKRVYLQCQNWALNNNLNPLEWGWKVGKDNILEPTFTSRPLIPETFLKKFSCGCKKGCMKKCGCRKLGLNCSVFCKSCKGHSCENCVDTSDEMIEENSLFENAAELESSILEPIVTIDSTEDADVVNEEMECSYVQSENSIQDIEDD